MRQELSESDITILIIVVGIIILLCIIMVIVGLILQHLNTQENCRRMLKCIRTGRFITGISKDPITSDTIVNMQLLDSYTFIGEFVIDPESSQMKPNGRMQIYINGQLFFKGYVYIVGNSIQLSSITGLHSYLKYSIFDFFQ